MIADNLGWFEDDTVNIETIMKDKGEEINSPEVLDKFT